MDIAQLVADYHQAVYRYAYRLTGSVEDAEDLTQQAFLVASGKIGQLREEGSAKAWLFAILRNDFIKQCRKNTPIPAVDLELNVDHVPEVVDEQEIDQQRLQQALNELPPDYRAVVLMFYFENLRYREMAEILGVPMGTIMSRLARAKDALRARLLEMEKGEKTREPNGPHFPARSQVS